MSGSKGLTALGLILGLGMALFGQQPQPPAAQADPLKKTLVKSLLFPGWGQFHEKLIVKGILFSTLEVFCLAQALVANHRADDYYWEYRHAATADEAVRLRQLTEKFDRKRNIYFLVGAGVWLINLVDIYLYAHKKYRKKVVVGMTYHGPESISLHLSIGF